MLFSKKISTPSGEQWKVGRVWVNSWPRLRRKMPFKPDSFIILNFDGIAGLVGGILLGLALFAVLFLLWPVIAVAVELVIAVFLVVSVLFGRFLLRKPWRVYARPNPDPAQKEKQFDVKGWRASADALEVLEQQLASGQTDLSPPTDAVLVEVNR